MANENAHQLNQDLVVVDQDYDSYDPLIDDNYTNRDIDDPYEVIGYVGDPAALAPKSVVAPVPEKTPREKIDELFSKMIPFKRYLLSIMEFCKEPQDYAQLDSFICELQAKRRTIFTTVDFCLMLEKAQAISQITEDGTPYDEVKVEPVEVEKDGKVFLEPGSPPPLFWKTTKAGLQVLEEDDPIKALQEIFADEAKFESVFLEVLELCDKDGGSSIIEIKEQANKNPVLNYPQKEAQFFLDYLDRNGAVIWDNNWKTTSIGKRALELLRTKGDV